MSVKERKQQKKKKPKLNQKRAKGINQWMSLSNRWKRKEYLFVKGELK